MHARQRRTDVRVDVRLASLLSYRIIEQSILSREHICKEDINRPIITGVDIYLRFKFDLSRPIARSEAYCRRMSTMPQYLSLRQATNPLDTQCSRGQCTFESLKP